MRDDQKKKFLHDELLALVIQATLQRSLTYDENVSEDCKAEFRNTLGAKLRDLASMYENQVDDNTHNTNIQTLSDEITRQFATCLFQERFRIGSAQKALNLYLKYLWCLDEIQRPPHCPFDNKIIHKLGPDATVNWTTLDNIAQYKTLVELARRKAATIPLAEWELAEYNDGR